MPTQRAASPERWRRAALRFPADERPPIVSITLDVPGAVATSDIRIPVPRGREAEAEALVRGFGRSGQGARSTS